MVSEKAQLAMAGTIQRQQGAIKDLKGRLRKAESELRVVEARLAATLTLRADDVREIEALNAERDELQAVIEGLTAGGGPVVDPTPPGTPWTHAYRGKDAATFKAAMPPGWDEARAGMPVREADPLRYELDQGVDIELANKLFTGPPKSFHKQVLSLFHSAKFDGAKVTVPLGKAGTFTMDNCEFNLEGNPELKDLLWFMRLWNLRELSVTRSDFRGREFTDGRQRPIEHALYGNVAGDVLVEWCEFADLGGKGPYFAYRDQPSEGIYPPNNVPFLGPATHRIAGCRIIDTEQDARKGSFGETVFDWGTYQHRGTILRENNVLATAWDFEREQGNNVQVPVADTSLYRPVRSCGLFVHSCYQWTEPYNLELYERKNELWYSAQANHSIGVIRNARNVVLSGICVETEDHRNPFVDIGGKGKFDMKPAERVTIENSVSATGAQARIWKRDGSFTLLPFDCPGQRFIWDGVTETLTEEAA